MKKALFPGSFDPVTEGHVEIIQRGADLFDHVLVAIGINSAKKYYFSLEERLEMLEKCFEDNDRISVAYYEELTVEFARKNGAGFLFRGLRSPKDLSYEQPIHYINHHLSPDIESVFLVSSPKTAHISSTIVREVIKYGGKLEGLVPKVVIDILNRRKEQF